MRPLFIILALISASTASFGQNPIIPQKKSDGLKTEEARSVNAINVSSYDAFHEIAGSGNNDSKVHLLIKETGSTSSTIRFINGLTSTPANNKFWDIRGYLWGLAPQFDIRYGNNNMITLLPDTKMGLGVYPAATLDIAGRNQWDLSNGQPGDFRLGSNDYNLRIGVATGGGGAGNTSIHTTGNMYFGIGNTARAIITSVGIGINQFAPKARIDAYKTGESLALFGNYNRSLKAAGLFDGSHIASNDPHDAIGIAAYGGNAPRAGLRNNIGIFGTAGGTAYDNIGVYGYVKETTDDGKFIYGVKGEAIQGGPADAYGIFGTVSGAGTGTKYAGYFNGPILVGSTVIPSDQNLKNNIKTIDSALEKILLLNPSTYQYKTDEFKEANFETGDRFGFTAQNVQSIFPQLVKEATLHLNDSSENKTEQRDKKVLAVNYTELIPILTKAIQEQQLEIAELRKEINALKK